MKKITNNELSRSLNNQIDNFQDTTSLELVTESKTIVGAINELYGKDIIANAIGKPLNSADTFNEMSNDINNLLNTFKTNMINNGVAVNSEDKFKELIDKIATLKPAAGTAVASDVLSGKTFINSTGNIITGTMTNQGSKTFTPSASKQTGAEGYYKSITVNTDSNLVPANIVSGKTIFGVTGTATKTVQFNASKSDNDIICILYVGQASGWGRYKCLGSGSIFIHPQTNSASYQINSSNLTTISTNGTTVNVNYGDVITIQDAVSSMTLVYLKAVIS